MPFELEDAMDRDDYQGLLGRLDRIEARIADCHKAPHLMKARRQRIIAAIAARETRMMLETPCPALLACLRPATAKA